jgi:acetyl-CoA carboxylase biotin carboxyl carrier protein
MKSKIDYQEILKLIDLLDERKLSRFELEVEGFKISIGRGETAATPLEIMTAAAAGQAKAASLETAHEGSSAPEERDDVDYVSSPMVGTFYRSPDPSSPPFVENGETVTKNQTLCIIEAMKLMNEIEADVDGVVEEIFVKNGKPVEYGQKLFAIKPA